MRQRLVAGNWKMHGDRGEVEALVSALRDNCPESTQVTVFPPYIYIPQVAELLSGSTINWGSQNISQYPQGAYTGEVAGTMLLDHGCTYALMGHSERRQLFGETDGQIAEKFVLAVQQGIIPILCLGETLAQREAGETESVVCGQLQAVIDHAGIDAFQHAVLAYEPVWAIGTGKTATVDQAQAVHALLRAKVAAASGVIADRLQILYGGSVKPSNSEALFAMPDIDGGLVGGASLSAEDFLAICNS